MPTLTLSDGRKLTYEEYGDPQGKPIFFQHGTGDSRLARYPDNSVTQELGIRLITADRPGGGGSTPKKGRTVLDWVPDAKALMDSLNIDKFVVVGHSGGGPHALAIALKLGDRVTKVGLASPLAPFDESGTQAMVKAQDLQMVWKLAHFKRLESFIAKMEAKHYRKDLHGFLAESAKNYPHDAPVFLDPVLEPMFEEEFGAAFEQSGEGALEDMFAFLDWGFKPEDIPQHVELFYGDADDILDEEMGKRLAARLPHNTFHNWAGAGHYGMFARDHWTEFFRTLA